MRGREKSRAISSPGGGLLHLLSPRQRDLRVGFFVCLILLATGREKNPSNSEILFRFSILVWAYFSHASTLFQTHLSVSSVHTFIFSLTPTLNKYRHLISFSSDTALRCRHKELGTVFIILYIILQMCNG